MRLILVVGVGGCLCAGEAGARATVGRARREARTEEREGGWRPQCSIGTRAALLGKLQVAAAAYLKQPHVSSQGGDEGVCAVEHQAHGRGCTRDEST